MRVTEKSRERESIVEALLLQRHRMLLFRLITARTGNRMMFFAIILFLLLINTLSVIQIAGVISTAILLTIYWYYEHLSLNNQVRAFEEILAKISGGEWEDIYIKTRYTARGGGIAFELLRLEPVLWFAIVLALTLSHYKLQSV